MSEIRFVREVNPHAPAPNMHRVLAVVAINEKGEEMPCMMGHGGVSRQLIAHEYPEVRALMEKHVADSNLSPNCVGWTYILREYVTAPESK